MRSIATITKEKGYGLSNIGADFFHRIWEEGWMYIKHVVDAMREPVLILDHNFNILTTNESFYKTFQIKPYAMERKNIFELQNGEWNIPALCELLEDILPRDGFCKDFEIIHEFPVVGEKILMVNARQIHFKQDAAAELFPPIILLAMEDVTEMMGIADMLDRHASKFGTEMQERTEKLEIHGKELKQQWAI